MRPDTVSAFYDVVWQGAIIASGATLIPALLVVIAGEVARIRSWLYYMVGGGVALAVIPLLGKIDTGTMTYALPALWHVFATAGFCRRVRVLVARRPEREAGGRVTPV